MKIGTWLLAMMQPLIARILTTLGLSVVTITGYEAAINLLKQQLITSINGLPAEMLQVVLLGGVGEGLGLITAAVAVRVLLWQIQSATRILGVNPQ